MFCWILLQIQEETSPTHLLPGELLVGAPLSLHRKRLPGSGLTVAACSSHRTLQNHTHADILNDIYWRIVNSREHCAVVSHDDFVQDGTNDAPVHFDLFGSRSKNLQKTSRVNLQPLTKCRRRLETRFLIVTQFYCYLHFNYSKLEIVPLFGTFTFDSRHRET